MVLTRAFLALGLRLPPCGRFPIPLSCGIVDGCKKRGLTMYHGKLRHYLYFACGRELRRIFGKRSRLEFRSGKLAIDGTRILGHYIV